MRAVRLLSIGLVLLPLLGLSACSADLLESEYTIRVSGTEGAPFSGSYMEMKFDGSNSSHSVDGIVPREYKVYGSMVSVAFQKQREPGTLRVEILRGGTLVSQSATSAAYGMVTIATQ